MDMILLASREGCGSGGDGGTGGGERLARAGKGGDGEGAGHTERVMRGAGAGKGVGSVKRGGLGGAGRKVGWRWATQRGRVRGVWRKGAMAAPWRRCPAGAAGAARTCGADTGTRHSGGGGARRLRRRPVGTEMERNGAGTEVGLPFLHKYKYKYNCMCKYMSCSCTDKYVHIPAHRQPFACLFTVSSPLHLLKKQKNILRIRRAPAALLLFSACPQELVYFVFVFLYLCLRRCFPLIRVSACVVLHSAPTSPSTFPYPPQRRHTPNLNGRHNRAPSAARERVIIPCPRIGHCSLPALLNLPHSPHLDAQLHYIQYCTWFCALPYAHQH